MNEVFKKAVIIHTLLFLWLHNFFTFFDIVVRTPLAVSLLVVIGGLMSREISEERLDFWEEGLLTGGGLAMFAFVPKTKDMPPMLPSTFAVLISF